MEDYRVDETQTIAASRRRRTLNFQRLLLPFSRIRLVDLSTSLPLAGPVHGRLPYERKNRRRALQPRPHGNPRTSAYTLQFLNASRAGNGFFDDLARPHRLRPRHRLRSQIWDNI